jgi:signal transduction histidine kinase
MQPQMKMSPKPETATHPAPLEQDVVTRLRALAHDLSNSIETIMQASYLLSQAELDDANRRWMELIDQATKDAARINREIREILRAQSAPTPR